MSCFDDPRLRRCISCTHFRMDRHDMPREILVYGFPDSYHPDAKAFGEPGFRELSLDYYNESQMGFQGRENALHMKIAHGGGDGECGYANHRGFDSLGNTRRVYKRSSDSCGQWELRTHILTNRDRKHPGVR